MARQLIAAAKPTKAWPELTEEEKDEFVQSLFLQMKRNITTTDTKN
jgi:hypothetical protein